MNNCITCKKQNKGNNWRNCRLKCHYKYEQQKKDEIYKLQEENKVLRKRFEELVSDLGRHCVQCTKEADNCMLRIENEKQKYILKEIKQIVKNQDLYRGRQALATKILQIIENVDQKESEER